MELISLFAFFITCIILINHFLHHFWSRRGFVQLKPKFLVGDLGDLFQLKKSIAEVYGDLYEKSKQHKICGIYFTYRPGLLVNDPLLVQKILVKDFHHFSDHGLYVDEKYDPLSGHLFSLKGNKWKNLRSNLSPLFSPGKLKKMFPTFLDCAVNLENHVEKCATSGNNVIEIRDLLARYTTDIIASVAFGIDNFSIDERDNEFRKMGAKVFAPSVKSGLRALMTFLMPKLNKYIGIKCADRDVEQFIFKIVKETIDYREKSGHQRNDFMQMMIKLKNGESLEDEGDKSRFRTSYKLTFEEVAAQAFVFFIAAFETTSSTISLCLYELSKNQSLQRKVQKEIDGALKCGGFSYDLMTQLKYLECCFDETLRKYPPAPFLIRECTKNYQINDLIIEEGTPIIISTFGLHRDSDIYENPLLFKPERFLQSSNGEGNSTGLFYIPFGDGPRICIGMKMGKLTAKLGLAILLSKFRFELEHETPHNELSFSPLQFVLTLKDDINLKATLRHDTDEEQVL